MLVTRGVVQVVLAREGKVVLVGDYELRAKEKTNERFSLRVFTFSENK